VIGAWRWWVAVWDRRERPEVLALVRIGVALVLLGDLLQVWRLGLVVPLFAGTDHEGLVAARDAAWIVWVGGTPLAAHLLHGGLVLSAILLALGVAARLSALALLLLWAQWAWMLPEADRAIDVLLRNVLAILAFSAAGEVWSVDAWIRTGSWSGTGELRPAWPRYLIVLQIVVMYFTAGVQKYAQHWWPWGDFSALYVILHDWSYAAADFDWVRQQPFWFGAQASTAITLAWQWSYPVVLVHYFGVGEPGPGLVGRVRRGFARWRLHWVWIALGAVFHLLIAATMELGIFPWGMLATYPVFLHPDELRAVRRR
jgi:hypothetical protein